MAEQETEDLKRQINELTGAMEEWKKTGTLSDRSLRNLKRSQDNLTKATDEQTDAVEEAERALKEFYEDLKDFGRNVGSTLQSVRENRESFANLNPAITGVSDVMQSTARGVGNLGTVVGGVVGGLTALIPGVGLFASVLTGLGAQKVVEAFGGVSEEVVKAGEAFFRFSTGEIDRVVGAFRTIGSVGAVGAQGIDGLYEASLRAGLSVSQFANLVGQNTRGLAFATGSSTEAARAIAEITNAAKPFQNQLLGLGIGLEDQSQIFSDYVVLQRRLGDRQTRDYATLAKGAAEYAFELDELSRLTGLSRTEAQQALESQMSNTRFRATLAKAEASGIEGLVKTIRGTAIGVEAFGGKRLAEGFQDAFGGLGTEAARQFEIATGGAGREIVERLRTGAISQDQALQQIQQSIQGRLQSLGGMDFVERVGKIGTIMDPMLLEMIEFSQRAGVTAEDMERLREEQRKARLEQTENTKEVVTAQQSLQGLAMQVDAIVKDLVFPNAATAVKSFTEVMETSIRTLAETAGIEVAGERAAGGPVTGGEPYLVGEKGPEIFTPGASGAITSNDIIQRLQAIRTGQRMHSAEDGAPAYGSTTFNGYNKTFLPGIGTAESITIGGGEVIVLKNLLGEIEKYVKYTAGNTTLQAYQTGGQTYGSAGQHFGEGFKAQTGFQQVGGPRSYYDSVMGDYTAGLDTKVTHIDGKNRTDVTSSADLVRVQEAMLPLLEQIAQSTKSGAESTQRMVRVASS